MNAIADSIKQRSATQITGELRTGDVLDGKYLLDSVVGEGAMGQVWRAKNLALAAPVAIKVVYAEKHGRDALSRLLTEARFEAQLCHPNVVRVFDVREGKKLAYVVMELLEGCTLADVMDEGPLPAPLAVRLLLPLLAGLSAAHSGGIVHRDIKPENIFIARGAGGRIYPKLLDFGIAHCATAGETHKPACVVGTPGYMAPEQAFGSDSVDRRADIWALGVVLYEAVTGGSAYLCKDYADYLRVLDKTQPPPLRSDAALWNILQRAMHKSAEQRFATSRDLSRALTAFLRDRDVFEDLSGDFLPEHWAAPGSHIAQAFRRLQAERAAADQRDTHARSCHADTSPPAREHTIDIQSKTLSQAQTENQVQTGEQRRGQVVSALIGGLLGVCIALAQAPSSHTATMSSKDVPDSDGSDGEPLQAFSVKSGLVELAKVTAGSESDTEFPEPDISAAGSHGERYAEHKPKKSAPPPKTKVKHTPPSPPSLSPEIPRDETLDRKVRKKPKRAYALPFAE